MTRKQKIIKLLEEAKDPITCQEITNKIIKEEQLKDNKALYLSGSISSILLKLYKEGIVVRHEATGPLGGWGYTLKSKG